MTMSRHESSARRDDDTYVLEYVGGQIRRLLLQGCLHDDYTERLLRLAGLPAEAIMIMPAMIGAWACAQGPATAERLTASDA
jgi:hypothetical protein